MDNLKLIDRQINALHHSLTADLIPLQAHYDNHYHVSEDDWEEVNVIWSNTVKFRLEQIRDMMYTIIMNSDPTKVGFPKKGLFTWVHDALWGETPTPKVGLGVVIVKNGKILLGTRKGSHCTGQRCVPGGHLEFDEQIAAGCLREVLEETGLIVKLRRFDEARLEWYVANNVLEGKHYVGIFVVVDWIEGEPKNREPEKNYGWEWVDYDVIEKNAMPGSAWLPTEMFVNYRDRILKSAAPVDDHKLESFFYL